MIIGRKVIIKDEVASTNDLAKVLAAEGEEEGTVVVARSQSAGKGRLGSSWSSPVGGLYLTVILRPHMSAGDLLRLTVMSGVPVAEAIEEITGQEVRLKWPNDVEMSGKKVAGILAEAISQGGSVRHVVLGIGINVNTDVRELSGSNPGSLASITHRSYDLEAFLHRLLYRLDSFYERFVKGEFDSDLYLNRSGTIGSRIVASVGDVTVRGQALYLDQQGALIIKGEDGLTYRLDGVYRLRYEG